VYNIKGKPTNCREHQSSGKLIWLLLMIGGLSYTQDTPVFVGVPWLKVNQSLTRTLVFTSADESRDIK